MTEEEQLLLREMNDFIRKNGIQTDYLRDLLDVEKFVKEQEPEQLLQNTIRNLQNPALHPELKSLAPDAPKPQPIFSPTSVEMIERWLPNPEAIQGLDNNADGTNQLGQPTQLKIQTPRPLPPGHQNH